METRCRPCAREVRAAWRRENKEKMRAARDRENARMREYRRDVATCPSLPAYREILRGDPCAYCGEPSTHIDHIEPTARGGANAWHNLTAACAQCNMTKKSKRLVLFLYERAGGDYPKPSREDGLSQLERADTPLFALLAQAP